MLFNIIREKEVEDKREAVMLVGVASDSMMMVEELVFASASLFSAENLFIDNLKQFTYYSVSISLIFP